MKLLVVSPFNIFPPNWGGASRIYNLLLSLLDNDDIFISLVFPYYGKSITQSKLDKSFFKMVSKSNIRLYPVFSRNKKFSKLLNPKVISTSIKVLLSERHDFILAEMLWAGLNAFIVSFLSRIPLLIDEHNIEFIRFKRMRSPLYIILRFFEPLLLFFSKAIFVVSDTDRKLLLAHCPFLNKKVEIIPNGFNSTSCIGDAIHKEHLRRKYNLPVNGKIILFFGKLDYFPNQQAIKIIVNEISKRVLNMVSNDIPLYFLIVGSGNMPYKLKSKNFIVRRNVPNIYDYIKLSDLVIVPLISGGGTRLKILESLACKIPVVSTRTGAEGLNLTKIPLELISIVDDFNWDKFSKEIVEKIYEPIDQLKNNVNEKWYLALIENYSWSHISKRLYHRLLLLLKHHT